MNTEKLETSITHCIHLRVHTACFACTVKMILIHTKCGKFPPTAVGTPAVAHTACRAPLFKTHTNPCSCHSRQYNQLAHAARHPWAPHRLPAVSRPPALGCGHVQPSLQHCHHHAHVAHRTQLQGHLRGCRVRSVAALPCSQPAPRRSPLKPQLQPGCLR